jgi:hypothetical protein
MTSLNRALLQLPFETFYTHADAIDSFFPVSLVLIFGEAILLGVALIQLIRFVSLPNIHLKKIIHLLIACQLIASITQLLDMSKFLGVQYQPFILFSVQEAAFIFSALAYFTVLLFWIDFNFKLRSAGPGIPFLQSRTFALLIFLFAACYIGACVAFHYLFAETVEEGWRLSFQIIWWHLAFYCIVTPAQLYYSYSIHNSLEMFYFTYSHSFDKTKKILHAVNFCFVLRTCSITAFVLLYNFSTQSSQGHLTSWPAFIFFYILDQTLPASIFIFLLRKNPRQSQANKLEYLHSSGKENINSASCTFTPGTCRP